MASPRVDENHTYGIDDVTFFKFDRSARFKIGKFCSLADNIKIFLGGNHRTDWITTYPFGHINRETFDCEPVPGHPQTNGDVIIGNDVWIGHSSTIMSGVSIGNGAVIAANSHVVADVAPYTIVGGNPAKFIRKRFDDEIIELLCKLKWWDLPNEEITELISTLTAPPTKEFLEKLIIKYRPDICEISKNVYGNQKEDYESR
jgi:acetyltransferase-like isoleucine patch superfamily enzyme